MSLLRDLLITKGCAEGVHQFETMILKSVPPADETLKVALLGHNYTSEAVARIVNSISTKEYEIRCVRCGKKAES